jgi:hypothetical protein
MATEMPGLDPLPRGLERAQLRRPGNRPTPKRGQALCATWEDRVSGLAVIGHHEPEVGAERGAHERLPLERRLGEDDRLQDEVEQEDGLADRGPDRLASFLARSTQAAGLRSVTRLAHESIER